MNTRPKIDGVNVSRKYRVMDGACLLLVTEDRKIYITTAPAGDGYGYSYIANVGDRGGFDDEPITKANVCRSANCY